MKCPTCNNEVKSEVLSPRDSKRLSVDVWPGYYCYFYTYMVDKKRIAQVTSTPAANIIDLLIVNPDMTPRQLAFAIPFGRTGGAQCRQVNAEERFVKPCRAIAIKIRTALGL